MLKKNLKEFELENGIKVIYYQRKELPLFSFAIGFDTGQYEDPEGKEGLFNLTISLIDKGTKKFDVFKISEFFDSYGARFDITPSKNFLTVSVLCREDFSEKIVNFLFHILTEPAFKEEEILKEKMRIITEILQEREEPEILVSKKFYEVLYENTPLSHPIEGYEETIRKIEKKDIENFYFEKILKKNIYISATTSLDFDKFKRILKNTFARLDKRRKDKRNFSYPLKISKKILILRDKVNQVFVRLGHFSLLRRDKNYSKLLLLNYILGGGAFASRLYKKIRNEKGLVYSVYSKFYPLDPFKGPFIYAFQTGSNNFPLALKILLEEIKKFKEKGPLKAEIEDAKGFFKGSIPRDTETYNQLTGMFLSSLKYGISPFFMYDTLNEMMKIDLKSAREFSNSFFDHKNICGTILLPEKYNIGFLKEIFPNHIICNE